MRTGFSRFLFLAHQLCKLFGVWRPSIMAAIQAHPTATTEQKATLTGLVNTIDNACAAVSTLRVVFE